MGALLALIPKKDIFYAMLIVALIAGGFWYHHKLIVEGIAKQQAIDDAASATLIAKTAEQTAELQAKATTAEQAYDKERNDDQNYRDSHPIEPVRLCLSTTASRIIVSQGGALNAGNAGSGPSSADVSKVPTGDSSSGGGAGPDIANLLGLLAGRADEVSAELREYQSR